MMGNRLLLIPGLVIVALTWGVAWLVEHKTPHSMAFGPPAQADAKMREAYYERWDRGRKSYARAVRIVGTVALVTCIALAFA